MFQRSPVVITSLRRRSRNVIPLNFVHFRNSDEADWPGIFLECPGLLARSLYCSTPSVQPHILFDCRGECTCRWSVSLLITLYPRLSTLRQWFYYLFMVIFLRSIQFWVNTDEDGLQFTRWYCCTSRNYSNSIWRVSFCTFFVEHVYQFCCRVFGLVIRKLYTAVLFTTAVDWCDLIENIDIFFARLYNFSGHLSAHNIISRRKKHVYDLFLLLSKICIVSLCNPYSSFFRFNPQSANIILRELFTLKSISVCWLCDVL